MRQTFDTTENLNQLDKEELDYVTPSALDILYDEIFGTKKGYVLKENTMYTLQKLAEWRDQAGGPKLGIISNSDERLETVLQQLGIANMFDVIVTSRECKFEKPGNEIFKEVIFRLNLADADSKSFYHVGNCINNDVSAALKANWNALRFNGNFDEDFPDWTYINTPETADEGADYAASFLKFGRRCTERNIEWIELWSLVDILQLLGFPEDNERRIETTYIKNVRGDE